MKKIKLLSIFLALPILLIGCATTSGKSPQEKKAAILEMQQEVLTDLYKLHPQAKAQIANAPGFGIFSNANVNVIFASFGGGYGVVTDNLSGRKTYMNMGEVGIGLGLGLKDFRAVFIFNDRPTMERFIQSGWEFGGHADAAAKTSDKGAAVGGEALLDRITIYQLTKTGLVLQATVKGTKYWKSRELN